MPSKTPPAGERVVWIMNALDRRRAVLRNQLHAEVTLELRRLGDETATLYRHQSRRLGDNAPASKVAEAVVGRGDRIALWAARRLQPIIQRHAQRVLLDTTKTVGYELGVAVNIPDLEARRIIAAGGTHLGMVDISRQARQGIMDVILEGRSNGDNPLTIARRIQHAVPAGRFVHAGPRYRAQLIARTETISAQRNSTLAAYRNIPTVTSVEIVDGRLEDSDDFCSDRDGDIVDFGAAQIAADSEHPNGTLSFNPVVG